MTDLEAYVTLNLIPKLGPVRLRRLRDALGGPQAILQAGSETLASVPGIGPEAARSIAGWKTTVDPEREFQLAAAAGARILCPSCPEYPAGLKEIHDPPSVLYMMGNLEPRDRTAVGVVGSRKPSHYATEAAKKISHQLAYQGVTVVSGLARGIDTAAHQGALAAKGRTLAVIGSGLNRLYPPENDCLARRIAESGAVLSEFPMETGADRQTFPMRNRIISGLSFGLLVVEAGASSGALISANQAAEQGRSLYAIPGRIDHPGAFGSNRLIQQGAKLIMSAEDILEDLQLLFPKQPELTRTGATESLSGEERQIYETMDSEEVIMDELIAKTGLPSHQVASTLLRLEMRRLVKQLPGSRFVKLL